MNEIINNEIANHENQVEKKPGDGQARFSLIEVRVLGCLIEKDISTPEYYPLTLNSLVAACNQKSNRDPAMLLDDKTVVRTLEDLRYNQQIVRQISSTGSRVPKYKHMVPDHWGFTLPELAVMCELFLRGPQTAGQLRTRAARLHAFTSIEEVEATLAALVTWEDGPFVVQLPRETGCREQRWAHLLSGEPAVDSVVSEVRPEPARLIVQAENERITALETDVAALRKGFDQLLTEFAAFRHQFD
ncbi:MAG: YceH family protein [Kiritimatiellia bacterium]